MSLKIHSQAAALCARVDLTASHIKGYVETMNYKQAQKSCTHMQTHLRHLQRNLRSLSATAKGSR